MLMRQRHRRISPASAAVDVRLARGTSGRYKQKRWFMGGTRVFHPVPCGHCGGSGWREERSQRPVAGPRSSSAVSGAADDNGERGNVKPDVRRGARRAYWVLVLFL